MCSQRAGEWGGAQGGAGAGPWAGPERGGAQGGAAKGSEELPPMEGFLPQPLAQASPPI